MKQLICRLWLIAALGATTSSMMANEPDSVYLFAYNIGPQTGLSFAYSADGHTWRSIGRGASFVTSDFARWGTNKKMYSPQLTQREDGTWDLVFGLGEGIRQYGHTTSPDLIHWKPQDYPMAASADAVHQMLLAIRGSYTTAVILGESRKGNVLRVPFRQVRLMVDAKAAAEQRARLDAESLSEDADRFSHLQGKPVHLQVNIDATSSKPISDKLIGIFFEDINYSADGGLYAELLQNRDFEYNNADHGREPNWSATHSWSVKGEGMTFDIATEDPLHDNQLHYAVLKVSATGAAFENDGFDGIVVRQGERYDVSLFARQMGGKAGRLKVQLRDGDRVIGETTLGAPSKQWKQLRGTLKASADAKTATLAIVPSAVGELALDFVSLFPQKTFKNRKNGMRADMAQVLADLHPRFMRFPGGCLVHGDGLGNMYHWKETIGPLHERKGLGNIWGYHQTRGLGYFEFFQLCEDLGCEPLPVLSAAVPCQNTGVDPVLGGGQQGGIPFGSAFEQYKQDVLDLIEWANGDAKTSKWARMRAEAGHPKPFNLKYIGIGNEDLISDTFIVRYLPLIEAVKAKYPDIIVCGTTGPFFEGSDYEEGWRLAKEHHIDMVDEHYYVSPGWYMHHQDFYDQYDRSASKVYLGEYACHVKGRKSTIESALCCAMHVCGLERNGDIVAMSSYAPLFAKHGHTQWNPDLVYFDNERVYPTVDYEVQRLCGQSQGDSYIASSVAALQPDGQHTSPLDAQQAGRVAVSTVRDSRSGRTYVKLVNLLPVAANTTLAATGLQLPATATFRRLTGDWNSVDARATEPAPIDLSSGTIVLPPYSFTVIEW